MTTARPPSGNMGQASGGITLDLTTLRQAANVARQSGRAVSREISAAFKSVQNEQRLAIVQANQALAAIRAQQQQITATTRAESATRIAAARAESVARQQAAKTATAVAIEEQRRLTATHKAEIRAREAAARAEARASSGSSFSLAGLGREALGAAGIGVGVAGVVQVGRSTFELAKMSAQAEVTADTFNSLARRVNLSGDEILASMRKVSRGTISDANLIMGANRALGNGVADSTEKMNQLLEISRAVGRAYGVEMEEAFSRIVRGISKLEPELLDEIGITVRLDQVFRAYAASIGTTTDRLTEAQRRTALFNEIAKQTQPVVDAAARRGDTAADKFDRLSSTMDNAKKAAGDLMLELGITTALDLLTIKIQQQIALAEGWIRVLRGVRDAGQQLAFDVGLRATSPSTDAFVASSAARDRSRHRATGVGRVPTPRFTDEQTAAIVDWADSVRAIDRKAAEDRLAETRSYEQQRTKTIADYEKGIARDAEDFARNRAQQEQDLVDRISEVHQAAAQREIKQAEQLALQIAQARADSAERIAEREADHARTIAERRADSAERIAEWEEDRDEAIAQKRKESADRILEMEEDFAKERERAQRDHRDKLMDAAARLDANAVFEEQRRFAREQADRQEAHDKELVDEREKLEDAIAQLNESHRKRLADEKKSLDKSIAQAEAAHQRQLESEAKALDKRIRQAQAAHDRELAEARAADEQRILDMQKDFDDRIAQEDADRAVRLGRMAADHNAQLAEMDRTHAARMNQITSNAGLERSALASDLQDRLDELETHNAAWIEKQKKRQEESIKLYDDWWDKIGERFNDPAQGPQPRPEPDPALNVRLQQLISYRDSLVEEQSETLYGSPEWQALKDQIDAVNAEIEKMGGETAATASTATASTAGAADASTMLANSGTFVPPVSPTGAGGAGVSVSIGSISFDIHGVPEQTAEELYDIIDQRIVYSVKRATGN